MRLDDSSAIVTGASSGIGRATAHELASNGANVAIAARRKERLHTIAENIEAEHGVDTLVTPTNVRSEQAVEQMVTDAVDRFGTLDILVNNAGLSRGLDEPLDELSTADYRAMMQTNIDGYFFATRAALPHLRETKGNLIFTGSVNAKFPYVDSPVYAGTKHWVRGFASSVEASEGGSGVAVTVVNPGTVRTEINAERAESDQEKFSEDKIISPTEVAEVIALAATTRETTTVSEVDIFEQDLVHNNWKM